MKKLFLTISLTLLLTSSFAQIAKAGGDDPRISFGLFQDARLALLGDDHGNDPFTTDVRFEFMMESNAKSLGSVIIGFTIEYADLSEFNFFRYGFQGGYNFRNLELPFNLGYFDNAIYGGAGLIHRGFPEDNIAYMSLELSNDFQIFLTDWLIFNLKGTLMQRGDLEARYGSDSGSYKPWDWGLNFYVGLKFYIGTRIVNCRR